jgi:hypothetical protein
MSRLTRCGGGAIRRRCRAPPKVACLWAGLTSSPRHIERCGGGTFVPIGAPSPAQTVATGRVWQHRHICRIVRVLAFCFLPAGRCRGSL